ncbi:M20/M25/M40 family metallo-hydrolase [Sediminibacterium goheungense]|uniref:Acetylornithine deacetylase/succinyl-diaminopimelate desuccinylase-like protein n=1 Tax=Sediminibacterium goheungense TaxID=1086393 RepID=A0A4R6IUY3_9BACT|nr:M20/M25/M40 family metallo-hydrolase [Sediminibacterium goheungense]TDO26439.1 acetylornithine deacetylase/succinyl-diaminopimelate desuccinylase-like protein [Sediminibacterium goheungense]
MKRIVLLTCMFLTHFFATTQSTQVNTYIQANQKRIIGELMNFLKIPNHAKDAGNIQMNAEFIFKDMERRGISNVQLLYPASKRINPAVYGEYLVPDATTTLVFYAHYDGQPVSPEKWHASLEPFKPVILNGKVETGAKTITLDEIDTKRYPDARIYARSSSDDKSGVMAILNAFSALQSAGITPGINIKFFFEGEEEAGSPHLEEILSAHTALLKSDAWIICDGPVHQSGRNQLVFGVRGDVNMEITVYGPTRPLHSGHYGNWAPNPGLLLVKLLASMKDENGFVTIKDFYNDVLKLTDKEKQALAKIPPIDSMLMKELGFIRPEMKNIGLSEALNLPSLNINGIESGKSGTSAANVIPVSASAVLDLRLVKGVDWKQQQERVVQHIRDQGFFITEQEPDMQMRSTYPLIAKVRLEKGYNAQKTDMQLPVMQKIILGLQKTSQTEWLLQPGLGGSLPLYVFEKVLNVYPVTLPIANHDNNQHAENENILISRFLEGISIMANLMILSSDK